MTTQPPPAAPGDDAARRLAAYLDALDHERATLAGRKHFFADGRIEERHGADGNTHVLYRGDLRALLTNRTELLFLIEKLAQTIAALQAESDQLRRRLDAAEGETVYRWDEITTWQRGVTTIPISSDDGHDATVVLGPGQAQILAHMLTEDAADAQQPHGEPQTAPVAPQDPGPLSGDSHSSSSPQRGCDDVEGHPAQDGGS